MIERALRAAVVRTVAVIAVAFFVSFFALTALGFAFAAFFISLSYQMNSAAAAGWTALLAFVVALVFGGIAALVLRPRNARAPRRAGARSGKTPRAAAIDGATGWILANPKSAAAAAFGIGAVLGLFPELRKDLAGALAAALRRDEQRND